METEEKPDIDWDELVLDATRLHGKLRKTQSQLPKGSMARKETGLLAFRLDNWCRFVETCIDVTRDENS